jgi:eukaryotic-like serine/threonine-protein kinase
VFRVRRTVELAGRIRYLLRMEEGTASPVREGEILAGRYRVERVLASGGMGVVVAARHVSLGQRVALKFLLSNLPATSEVAARFEREGKAAALLRSEHVARVTDIGQLENGAPFMVMEFLDGSDLATVVEREGPLSIPSAVEYVLQTCEGLAEAHAAHIVHRDLKPSNLFRTMRPDGSPLIKILDFGISKVDDASSAAVTSTAAVLGSPLYMSPEQMQSSKSVDARSDIWSLGVVLHQLLTGKPPFEEETLPALCVAIATKAPTSLRSILPNAPPELEAIINRCLQKSPAARFQNVAELATALAPFCPEARSHVDRTRRLVAGNVTPSSGHLPVEADPRSTTDPFGPTKTALAGSMPSVAVPRKRSPMIVVAAIAGVVVLGGAAFLATNALGEHKSAASAPSNAPATTREAPTSPAANIAAVATAQEQAAIAPPAARDAAAEIAQPPKSKTVATQPAATPHAPTHGAQQPTATAPSPQQAAPSLTGFSSDRK